MLNTDQVEAIKTAIDERIATLDAMVEECQAEIKTLQDSKTELDPPVEPANGPILT